MLINEPTKPFRECEYCQALRQQKSVLGTVSVDRHWSQNVPKLKGQVDGLLSVCLEEEFVLLHLATVIHLSHKRENNSLHPQGTTERTGELAHVKCLVFRPTQQQPKVTHSVVENTKVVVFPLKM